MYDTTTVVKLVFREHPLGLLLFFDNHLKIIKIMSTKKSLRIYHEIISII